MKKYLVSLGVMAVLLAFAHSAHAYLTTQEAVDTFGRQLQNGDLISASDYGDPDIFIIQFARTPGLVGSGTLADAGSLGYKRLFLNPVIFSFYGHLGGFANVHRVTLRVRDAFGTSGLFRNCETGDQRVWATEVTSEDAGVLHYVRMSGDQAASQDAYFFLKIFCINTREESWYAKSIQDYTNVAQIPTYSRALPVPTPPITVNVASSATVIGSSENTVYQQLATKAVDGSVIGYTPSTPGADAYTHEWVTINQREGAWLRLSWSTPQTIDRIVLYDRPNLDDQITSATIQFSDGTFIPTGVLNNNGSSTLLTFGARTVTSVQLNITGVSASTQNIGLAEIMALTPGSNPPVVTNGVMLTAISATSINSASPVTTITVMGTTPTPCDVVGVVGIPNASTGEINVTASNVGSSQSNPCAQVITSFSQSIQVNLSGYPFGVWGVNGNNQVRTSFTFSPAAMQ